MEKDQKVRIQCSYCGRTTSNLKRGSATEFEPIKFKVESEGEERDVEDVIDWQFTLLQCEICDNVSLHVFSDMVTVGSTQMYPPIKDLSGIPMVIKNSYEEAKKVKSSSPVAFMVLMRRALEYICKDQNATGKSLEEKLKDLSNRNIIPATLSRMTQAIRYFGNLSAHATDFEIGSEEVFLIDDFFVAVVEYVYIAPEKLRRAEKRASRA